MTITGGYSLCGQSMWVQVLKKMQLAGKALLFDWFTRRDAIEGVNKRSPRGSSFEF